MTKLSNKVINTNNRRTSIRLCSQEWNVLEDACKNENIHRNELISLIEKSKASNLGLSYATRVFLLLYFRNLALSKDKSNALTSTLKELL
ncbi:MAG: ribbon-helix-helix domain-containing protein [Alphaproteobacteria bacterium]|nr:ribbon-helix-helix domain-containing protein [Alphaproteobacteria bacterium]